MIGGGVGIAGHLEIADRVQVTGMSLVAQSITEPGAYSSGLTVEPNRVWNKISARLRRLDELFRRLAVLEQMNQNSRPTIADPERSGLKGLKAHERTDGHSRKFWNTCRIVTRFC